MRKILLKILLIWWLCKRMQSCISWFVIFFVLWHTVTALSKYHVYHKKQKQKKQLNWFIKNTYLILFCKSNHLCSASLHKTSEVALLNKHIHVFSDVMEIIIHFKVGLPSPAGNAHKWDVEEIVVDTQNGIHFHTAPQAVQCSTFFFFFQWKAWTKQLLT